MQTSYASGTKLTRSKRIQSSPLPRQPSWLALPNKGFRARLGRGLYARARPLRPHGLGSARGCHARPAAGPDASESSANAPADGRLLVPNQSRRKIPGAGVTSDYCRARILITGARHSKIKKHCRRRASYFLRLILLER